MAGKKRLDHREIATRCGFGQSRHVWAVTVGGLGDRINGYPGLDEFLDCGEVAVAGFFLKGSGGERDPELRKLGTRCLWSRPDEEFRQPADRVGKGGECADGRNEQS
jgi:hypothetical protein